MGRDPAPLGPVQSGEVPGDGPAPLDAYLDEAADRGVPVLVWLPSLPLPESYYEETLSHNHVDLAVLPDHLDRPKLTERLLGSFAARVARAMAPGVPVLEVAGGGGLALLR